MGRRNMLPERQEPGLTSTEELANLRSLKNSLVQAYRQTKYCDITVKSKDGVEVKAHKVVLATQCNYFSQKLDKQQEENELVLKDISGEALKIVVEYIYSGKMKVNQVTKENAKDILNAGELCDIEVVKEEAGMFMAKNLDVENAVDVMTKDVFVGAVSNNAFTFVGQNFQTFLDTEHLKKRLISELGVGQVCHLLCQKSLMLWDTKTELYLPALEREKKLFFFVMAYVAHDKTSRLPDLSRLLTCLKLPVLAVGKVLSLAVMAAGLKEKEEELSGQLVEVLEPFESLTGKENLATLFADRGARSQVERRMLADTCKMRYATIPHMTSCSEIAPATNPYAGRQSFCPNKIEKRVEGNIVRSITVFRVDLGMEEGRDNGDYRLCGLKVGMDEEVEMKELGLLEHHTMKEETHTLEEGEFITQIMTHHRKSDLQRGDSFRKGITSLTNISDLSFITNKKRTLGPSPTVEGDPAAPPLGLGLTIGLPTKLQSLEKNCPGSFHWLAGFGIGSVKLSDTTPKTSFFPVWRVLTHFKVYPVESQAIEFVSGVKKHYQFSVEGLTECSSIDDQQDLEQAERSPVHEVVDLEDSDSENEESEDEMTSGMMPRGQGSVDDSVMVVDSDSEDAYEEEEEEEEEEDEDEMRRGGGYPLGRQQASFRPQPTWKGSKGGADEPIEIESSSEEEEEREKAKSAAKKVKETNGNANKIIEEAALKVNGGDPNLNLSEDSSEEEDDGKSAETNHNKETEKDIGKEKNVTEDKEDEGKGGRANKRKCVTEGKEGKDKAKKCVS